MSQETIANQPYLYPKALFQDNTGQKVVEDEGWTCVWTKPRQEKKLSKWLASKDISHYLPVTIKETISHRRKRIVEAPLFASYLFVRGQHGKKTFVDSNAVVETLTSSTSEAMQLTESLKSIWQGLNSGGYFKLVNQLSSGDLVEVVRGPFKGMKGHFEAYDEKGTLIVWINVLGVGATLELDDPTVIMPLEKTSFAN